MTFVNLHRLPVGSSLYTLVLSWDGSATDALEELDVVAAASATPQQVVDAAWAEISADYEPGAAVLAVLDQSAGCVLFDGSGSGCLTGRAES